MPLVVVTLVLNLRKLNVPGKDVVLVDIVDTVLNGYYDKDFTDIMAENRVNHTSVWRLDKRFAGCM